MADQGTTSFPASSLSEMREAPTLLHDGPAAGGGLPERLALPGYEVVEEVGRGGTAVVYRALQTGLKRLVAVKMILGGAHAGAVELARFRIEAEAVAQLQHPHIVQVYEVGQHNGCPYLTLEWLEGGSLAEKLTRTAFTPEQSADLVETVARTVQAAHDKGIIHRDLKPGNVLLTADGRPKVSDFGLAKRADSAVERGERSSRPFGCPSSPGAEPAQGAGLVAPRSTAHHGLTRTGAVMGTPGYMAPEQAEGKKAVGPAAHVSGLGSYLYELLTGRPPFQAATPLDIVLQVVSEEPAPPRKLQSSIPRDLETICLKCLEKDPRRRYGSAQALADDLRCFLRGEAIAARPPGVLGRLDRWARLRPALAATLVALTLFYLFHLLLIGLGVEGEGGAFHWFVTALVTTWGLGAVAFHSLSSRTRWRSAATWGWAALDVLLLTVFLARGDGPRSALLVGYHLLIAGTTLRFRIGLIWFVTGLSVVSYLGVVAETLWRRPWLAAGLKDWVVFVLSLVLIGFIQQLLLRRLLTAGRSER